MNYKLRTEIAETSCESYAKDYGTADLSGFLDCSTGINPFGIPRTVEEQLDHLSLDLIHQYPHSSQALKSCIAAYWSDTSLVREEDIILGGGSIEILYKLNKLFIGPESLVLGYSPQFPSYVSDVKASGGAYECYALTKENGFRFDPDRFLGMMGKQHALFYIDNPNNPTGQVIPLNQIEKLVKKGWEMGRPVVIDEAYGDFKDKSNSAISLLPTYDNLLVVRTFSKGWGLAGLRAGYLITSSRIAGAYNAITNPYEINGLSRFLCAAAMQDQEFMGRTTKKIRDCKVQLMKSLTKLTVLPTDESVPIMTLVHPDAGADLEKLLRERHILSVSGNSFSGLSKNSVRLLIPSDPDLLLLALAEIEDEILVQHIRQ